MKASASNLLTALARGLGRQAPLGTSGYGRGPRDPDPMLGFASGAEFIQAIVARTVHGIADERLVISAGPTTVDQEAGSSDGFLVPPAIRDEVWDLVTDDGTEIYNLLTPEPTLSNQVQVITDETTPWGSSGIQANWRGENQQLNPSKLKEKLVDLKLSKLYAYALVTDELLADAPRLYDRLTRQSARAIVWKCSESVMNGTGVMQPLGFMNAPCLVKVAKESGQGAATITATNLGRMMSRMPASSLKRAYWVAHTDTIEQLLTLTIGGRAVFIPDTAALADKPNMGTILGRPVVFTEHASALGDAGDISLIDPLGYYAVTKKSGTNFAQSMHLYFDLDIMAFRWTFRLGGQPFLSAPITRNKGTNTQSHFVTLDNRH